MYRYELTDDDGLLHCIDASLLMATPQAFDILDPDDIVLATVYSEEDAQTLVQHLNR